VRFVFVVKSKISLFRLPFFFLFFLSQTSSGFRTCEIHSHAITEKKKKKKRVSVVVSKVSVVVLSSEESFSLLCRRFVSIDR
jgi:hypothetical protein